MTTLREAAAALLKFYEEQQDEHSLCGECNHWLPDHADDCPSKMMADALRAALSQPPERGEYARGWRAGVEAAANEAWNTVAAHACDTIPLSLADELATALRSLSPPEEPLRACPECLGAGVVQDHDDEGTFYPPCVKCGGTGKRGEAP